MDSTTMLIIGAIVVLAAVYLYNRSRPAARGTYDDKNVRSSGSIGGGTRAYDDESVRSSGSIGGSKVKAYDSPEHSSRGSIGGQPTSARNDDDDNQVRSVRNRQNLADESSDSPLRNRARANDDENHRSGGSFGR
jgi:hypothetical protein